MSGLQAAPAFATNNGPTISSAVYSGSGTVTTGGTLYAKSGTALTLTVTTSTDAGCVIVTSGTGGSATTVGFKTTATSSTTTGETWAFPITAASGSDGAQGLTIGTSGGPNSNKNACTGPGATTSASYSVDNTGPTVTSPLSGTKGTAPWYTGDVTVNWTAVDAGVGVASQRFKTDTVTTDGTTTLGTAPQQDLLGNVGAAGGSVTVYRDSTKPTISGKQVTNPDGTVTVTFTCGDATSGIATTSGCLAAGSTTNAVTITPSSSADTTVNGTAKDNAGNTNTASVVVAQSDTVAPTVTGAAKTKPNGNGWYKDDVVIGWTCTDNIGGSGVKTSPADSTVTGEGGNQGVTSGLCTDNAGNSATGSVSGIQIDRTAPTTAISGTSNSWVNGTVTVTLTPSDNLSGVDSTTYSIDSAMPQTGTSFSLTTEGDHTVTFFSTDKAGNAETAQTVHVKIDKTAPTIGHVFDPITYTDSAWANRDVKVTFTCADQGGSAIATCTSPVTKSAETSTAGDTVTGTATDNAGNSSTDTAMVRIDKTAPTIAAAADSAPNANGWYNHDVTVHYTANDALSGIATVTKDSILREGASQSARGTATDNAGNSASDGVSGINIDETAPVLTGTYDKGWHTGDVTVVWTCTDAGGSGVEQAPTPSIVKGEGSNLTATASCTDNAGNSTTTTVDGIEIDRTAPTTTPSVPEPNSAGWYGSAVQVTLNATDNLSGIAATYYSVDGGATQTYSDPFSYKTEGTHTISFWSKDGAGNLETAGAPITLQIDTAAPKTTVIAPVSPDSGWFVTSGIPVAFGADDGTGSGVAATYYTIDGGATQTYGQPFDATLSTGTHKITYWSVDVAGNAETHATTSEDNTNTVSVSVDTTPPTITGNQDPAANAAGWNNTPVKVTFTCADVGSGVQTGVAGCAGDTTLSNDGSSLSVAGEAIDVAGNKTDTSYGPVNIDQTKPTLVGVPADANAAGWYNGDVNVTWVGSDAGSGIDPKSQPADSPITGEGSNLGAGPVAIMDKAGNTSDNASVTGIKIDRTAPVVTGGATTQPNSSGWYRSSVTVDYKCTDPKLADGTAGSGVARCPTSDVLSQDGANQSVTSASATDVAGNTSDGLRVGGINIDGKAPSTMANNKCTVTNGYCTGSSADVVLTATDQAGLSGVKEIHYIVNGGTEQVVGGASATATVDLSGTGNATVKYWAVDNAGNAETANSTSLKWDNIAPTVTHTLSPAANAAGWNNADTTVTFSAKDDDAGSGVNSSTLTAPVAISNETAGQLVNGSAKDTAGNLGTDSVTVKLDKTNPTISGAVTSGTKGSNGWYVGPVTVSFTCADSAAADGAAGSGVATCPDPVTLTANGSGQTASGTVTDNAGNSASATVSGINIDQEKPTITKVNVDGATYQLGSVPAATCTASDSFSGVDSCTVAVTGGTSNGVGTFSYTATATDKAGNTNTATGTYTVTYRWDGFLQPINDTAHQIGTSVSVFKAGSTIPVKFQLKNAAGTAVKAVVAPQWLAPVKGTAMTVAVNDSASAASVDSGSAFTYDSASGQYQYNWKTPSTGGSWYSVGVKLDDGQVYHVAIGLK